MDIPIIGAPERIKVSKTLAPVAAKYGSYVMEIFSEGEFVVYHLNKIHEVTNTNYVAIPYLEADRRMTVLTTCLAQEDGGKSKEETDYDRWLLENTVKACERCAKHAGKPYRNWDVEQQLRKIDRAAKTVKNRSDKI